MKMAGVRLIWALLLPAALGGLPACTPPDDPVAAVQGGGGKALEGGIESHLVLRNPPSVLEVPAVQMRQALEDAYRPRPDKRFLLAVADVHRFLSGEERQLVETTFRSGRWHLSYRGLEAGSVPEFPDFADLLEALDGWARTVARDHPLRLGEAAPSEKLIRAQERLDRFLAPEAAVAAVSLDELWRGGERNPEVLAAAARALTLLTFQFLDRTENGDLLPARALAMLTLTRTMTNHETTRLETLIAEALGYAGHAAALGRKLAPSDPLRALVQGDHAMLEVLAAGARATPETRYFALAGLAERGDPDGWSAAADRLFPLERYSLPVLKTGLDLERFETDRAIALRLPLRVLLRAMAATGTTTEGEAWEAKLSQADEDKVRDAQLVSEMDFGSETVSLPVRLEEELQTLQQQLAGPFFDGATYGAYFRSYFYSGLMIHGLHELDSRSSVSAAELHAQRLEDAPEGVAGDLGSWYQGLTDSKAGRPDPARLAAHLGSLPSLGAAPLVRTFEELWEVSPYADPLALVGAKRLVARMDTRIDHLRRLAPIARTRLLDLPLTERLYEAVLAAAPAEVAYIRSWHAYLGADTDTLLEMADSEALDLAERARAVEYLEFLEALTEREVRARYETLIREDPTDWDLRADYLRFLRRQDDPAGGIAVVRDWLADQEPSGGLDYIAARTSLGRLWAERRRYQEALEAVLPVVGSMQAGAMERAAIILDQAGRPEEAEALFRSAVERYPDLLRTTARYARFLWSHGRHEYAARLLSSHRLPIGVLEWRDDLGEPFAEVFAQRPKEEVVAAFQALERAGVEVLPLQQLALRIYWTKRYELAFRLATLPSTSGLQRIDSQVTAYRYLSAWRGEAEAEDWLREQIPPSSLGMASMIFYDRRQYDLLWTLIDRPGPARDESFVWLMRAAAWLREETPAADGRAIRDFFTHPRADPYHTMGRYLVGLASREEILALATDTKKRCEIAYYLGLKEHTDGRYEAASDWYRVSVETGLERNGEYRWAYNALHDWIEETKSLSRLAAAQL